MRKNMDKISPSLNGVSTIAPEADLWQALQLFNLYRMMLAFSFWMFANLNIEEKIFSVTNDSLYKVVSLNYFLLSLFLLSIPFFIRRYYHLQINLCIFLDITAIILLMHACGGTDSGIGLLLIVLVAAHSLLVSERWALFSAAFATIFLIFEHIYNILKYDVPLNLFTQIGLLGSVLLISAYMINTLAIRTRQHQQSLIQQTRELNAIQQLNTQIVNAMHEGVMVFDSQQNIKHINNAAYHLLNFYPSQKIENIKNLPRSFQQAFDAWKKGKREHYILSHNAAIAETRLNFQPLGKEVTTGTIVFIYDATQELQRAHDLKLASLGHLTANIAHELRNPLGAISHASQLLNESFEITSQEHDLIKIIHEHCDRMNAIIQNVLSISSRKKPEISKIKLFHWLKKWIKNFSSPDFLHPIFSFKHNEERFTVQADPSQLTQVLINLCENGLRASFRHTGQATLTFRLKSHPEFSVVTLDIIDQGFGIPKTIVKHIFEPFFTTEKSGSGLGLYLAKELCDINNIRLETIVEEPNSGAIFRLTFPLYQNHQERSE